MLSPLAGLWDPANQPDLLVGLGVADDAAVYRINATTAVVATLDFFAPVVDDPWTYGAIAAANAMSDVYAMGGEVVLALNIAAFPQGLPPSVQTEILRGAAQKVAEAGAVIAGGHTIWDEEPKFGLSVLGIVHPKRIFRKNGLRPGDVLYLSKPLGTGVVLSAVKSGRAEAGWLEAATESMLRLNRHPSHIARAAGVRAATDVTGFGLAGHLWEMAERSGVTAEIDLAAIPVLPGARECAAARIMTGGAGRNREWAGANVSFAAGAPQELQDLVFDPQTSGGLLIGVPRRRAAAFEAADAGSGQPFLRVGRVRAGAPHVHLR